MSLKYLFVASLIALSGCSSVPVEPADDQWERSEEKMSGLKSGDSGWFTVFSSQKKTKNEASTPTQTSTPVSAAQPATQEQQDYREFQQWQLWQKQKNQGTADYQEFQEWLKFKSLKNQP